MLALGILVAAGATFAFAQTSGNTWTGPQFTPPSGNVAAPINISSTTQIKLGNLVLNGLSVNAATILNGTVQIASGNPQTGYILTALDASGTTRWEPAASGTVGKQSHSAVYIGSGTAQPSFHIGFTPDHITFEGYGTGSNYPETISCVLTSASYARTLVTDVPGSATASAYLCSGQFLIGFTLPSTGSSLANALTVTTQGAPAWSGKTSAAVVIPLSDGFQVIGNDSTETCTAAYKQATTCGFKSIVLLNQSNTIYQYTAEQVDSNTSGLNIATFGNGTYNIFTTCPDTFHAGACGMRADAVSMLQYCKEKGYQSVYKLLGAIGIDPPSNDSGAYWNGSKWVFASQLGNTSVVTALQCY